MWSVFLQGEVINEGFIFTIIEQIKKFKNYNQLRIGLLGMSFKPNIDDTRVSLSYKLKKHLKTHKKLPKTLN